MGIGNQLRLLRTRLVPIKNVCDCLTLIRCKRRDIDQRLDPIFVHRGDHSARVGMSHQDYRAAGAFQCSSQSNRVVVKEVIGIGAQVT